VVTDVSSGLGIAQMSEAEKDLLIDKGLLLLDGNLEDPDFAVKAMAARMNAALTQASERFPNCSPQDKLIIAGLSHNAQFVKIEEEQPAWGVKHIPKTKSDGSPNWKEFYGEDDNPSAKTAIARQEVSGYQYSKQLMVILYIKNLRVLHSQGWELPFGLTPNDLDEVEEKVKEKFNGEQ
jgi:hypothetical protein